MPSSIALVAQPSGLDVLAGRISMTVAPGATLAEMIALAMPDLPEALRGRLRVTIGEDVILPGLWRRVRPKPGTQVLIRAVPGNDQVTRAVLTAVVAVAAIAAGQYYGPALAGALLFGSGTATGLAATVSTAAITGSTLLAGTLLINALVPPRPDKKDQPSYSVQGTRNQLTPNGVVPLVLGKVRFAPPYAAKPFTTAILDYRYVTAAFCVGYGPLALRNWRIGRTPIEHYVNITFEQRQGYADDQRLTLYPRQVVEDQLTIQLQSAFVATGGPQIRVTAADVTGCEIDTTYPSGVFATDKDGGYQFFSVVVLVRYRLAGTTDWTTAPPIVATSKLPKSFTLTTPIAFSVRGRYEIELTRQTIDWDEAEQGKRDTRYSGRSAWSALRGFRPEYPIAFDKPLALAACKIQATGQLNGVLDELNVEASSICPDWDAATGSWVARETNNPASLFRWVLTGPAITYPLAENEIAALGDWHAFCVAKGLTYNRVHDYEASVLDVLADIAAAGRASPHDTGTTWGVVIDRALSVVSAHISPRNSWGFSGERPYAVLPDAFRISFLDETNDYEQAERVVPRPGFAGDPKVTEKIEMPGVTNPDMVWREGIRRWYEILKRPDTYTVNQDFEALTVARGDRAQLSHDVLERTQVAARVTGVAGAQVSLDEAVTFTPGQTYACRFRADDGRSVLRTVAGLGTTHTVLLTGNGDAPAVGNLALFGPSLRESFACTVKGVEAMENFCARLTLVDHAPEIEALVDAEVPPAWSGRAGGPAQDSVAA